MPSLSLYMPFVFLHTSLTHHSGHTAIGPIVTFKGSQCTFWAKESLLWSLSKVVYSPTCMFLMVFLLLHI